MRVSHHKTYLQSCRYLDAASFAHSESTSREFFLEDCSLHDGEFQLWSVHLPVERHSGASGGPIRGMYIFIISTDWAHLDTLNPLYMLCFVIQESGVLASHIQTVAVSDVLDNHLTLH